ncbi:MAG: HIRAN protein [Methylotenera sp.]|nr:HIRAN protein [Methylotenera sp.]
MYRRQFIKAFAAAFAGLATSSVAQGRTYLPDQTRTKLLQISSIAGFQYYQGDKVWPQLVQGQQITLQREPTNTYDARAVAVYWEQQKLGFIPRLDNAAISQLLDRGEVLRANIYSLAESDNPWERVEVEVRWVI